MPEPGPAPRPPSAIMTSSGHNGSGISRLTGRSFRRILRPCCRAGGNAPLNGSDVLPVRGTRHLSASALPSTLRCALDVLSKEPPDAAPGTPAAAPRSTRTSSASGHNRTRRCNRRAERSGWIVGSAADGDGRGHQAPPGRAGTGKAGPVITGAPPGTGSRRRQPALIVARGWPGFAAKASRRRGIPVVSRHPGIKRKGLAVSWLTHCRYRLSRRWRIRSRS
jgi:hypothetical protein